MLSLLVLNPKEIDIKFAPSIMENMMNLKTVYYFPLDQNDREQEPVPITILPNGEADISKLPNKIQNHFQSFGIPNEIKSAAVFPETGQIFIEALLASSNQKMHFRSTPKKI